MLSELYVDNIAIVDKLTVRFTEGFNVITGESGAGKSILVRTMKLLCGEKADRSLIGNFRDSSVVEGVFLLPEAISSEILTQFGLKSEEEGLLVVTRELHRTQASVARVNGRVVTLSTLRQIVGTLLDVYGQHNQSELTNPVNYLEIVDSFGGEDLSKYLEIQKNLYAKQQEILRRFQMFDFEERELDREKEILTYQKNEIRALDVENIDFETVTEEWMRFSNLHELRQSVDKVLAFISYGREKVNTVDGLLDQAIREMRPIGSIDSKIGGLYDQLLGLTEQLSDFSRSLFAYREVLDVDEEQGTHLNELWLGINDLKKKYGSTQEEILEFLNKIEKRLEELERFDEIVTELNIQKDLVTAELEENSEKISKLRRNVGEVLQRKVQSEMRKLAMPHAIFRVVITPRKKINATGRDDIEFLVSANAGEDPQPLATVASGGEQSRIMLAFKTAVPRNNEQTTLVFDEIDSGVSGRTAQIVGEELLALSRSQQIISISHLPQIAALAENHFLIYKTIVEEKTVSSGIQLREEKRVDELARLIGGADITEKTRESAAEMLQQGEQLKEKR